MASLHFTPPNHPDLNCDQDSLGFEDGKLTSTAATDYGTWCHVTLSEEQTRKLYEHMREYYAQQGET